MNDRIYDDTDDNPLAPHIWYRIPGTEEFEFVASFSDGGGYDWTDWVAWYSRAERRFFIASGSGCSCNSLADDYWTLGDFEAVATKAAAVASLQSFVDDRFEYRSISERPRLDSEIAAINSFRARGAA